jgi:hypothetical protein
MLGVPAELHDIPLGDPHVLQEFPRTVRVSFGARSAQVLGKFCHGIIERGMGVGGIEQPGEAFTKFVLSIHLSSRLVTR